MVLKVIGDINMRSLIWRLDGTDGPRELTSWRTSTNHVKATYVDGLRSENRENRDNRDLGFTRFGAGVSHRFPG